MNMKYIKDRTFFYDVIHSMSAYIYDCKTAKEEKRQLAKREQQQYKEDME